ncbi:MAG: enamine deaminase RidA, partial [Acidimicrobiales bacterium]|nr:enamine deaminase RidA [Acidimicrobiales bacterium]
QDPERAMIARANFAIGVLVLLTVASTHLAAAAEAPVPSATIKPFSDAAWVGGVLYTSGQIGVKPGETHLTPGGMPAEARQAMDNLGAILKANGVTFDDVFKCTVALSDMSKWGEFNSIYLTYFKPGHLPVRNAFGASALAYGGQIEIDCLARKPTRRGTSGR